MLADSFFYYLVLVGFAAGLMDAAVGGGGLLQIPDCSTYCQTLRLWLQ